MLLPTFLRYSVSVSTSGSLFRGAPTPSPRSYHTARAAFATSPTAIVWELRRDESSGSGVTFAAETGAQIIAEGVEDEDELRVLRRLGVSCAQGFHLGRPVTPEGAFTRSAPKRKGVEPPLTCRPAHTPTGFAGCEEPPVRHLLTMEHSAALSGSSVCWE